MKQLIIVFIAALLIYGVAYETERRFEVQNEHITELTYTIVTLQADIADLREVIEVNELVMVASDESLTNSIEDVQRYSRNTRELVDAWGGDLDQLLGFMYKKFNFEVE